MTLNTINIGTAPNDGTGDPARTAFEKTNDAINLLNKQDFTDIYVTSSDDFPPPTNPDPAIGVINLASNTRYIIRGEVPVQYPMNYGANTLIQGTNSLLDILVYTGARTGLIATAQNLYLQNVSYIAVTGTAYEKTGGGFFIVRGVVQQFLNFGSIESDSDMIIDAGLLFLSGTGVVITNGLGNNSFFGIAETRVVQQAGQPIVDYRNTTIDSVLIRNNDFVPVGGSVVVAGDANSSNINNSAQFSGNQFNLALGQAAFTGITTGDIRYYFNANIGVGESVILGSALLENNTTPTTIPAANTFVNIGGTFVSGDFDQRTLVQAGGGRIDNLSGETSVISLGAVGVCDNQGGGTQSFQFIFQKNGVKIPNYSTTITVDGNDQNTFQLIGNVELAPGEFVELKVANTDSDTNCLIESCQFIIRGDV